MHRESTGVGRSTQGDVIVIVFIVVKLSELSQTRSRQRAGAFILSMFADSCTWARLACCCHQHDSENKNRKRVAGRDGGSWMGSGDAGYSEASLGKKDQGIPCRVTVEGLRRVG